MTGKDLFKGCVAITGYNEGEVESNYKDFKKLIQADNNIKIVPRFTASALSNEIASALQIDRIELGDCSPKLDTMTDLYTGQDGGTLTQGMPVRVSGTNLKVGGEGCGVFIAPVQADGSPDADEASWMKAERLVCNKPRTLEFFLPKQVAPGTYRIAVRTACSGNNTLRKTALTGYSKAVTVVPES